MSNTKKTLVFLDGKKIPILGETRRYWICKNTQFLKSNPQIKEVRTEKEKGGEK